MEVQGPQEALKVEIQCHQNQTLCKGLNDLPNGQLAVRSRPVGAGKPLSLLTPPGQAVAISTVPAATPATVHVNGAEPPQTSPVDLQTSARAALGPGAHPSSQMLSSLSLVPVKVPQVGSLHRLTASVLPQVRPKTLIPDGLPPSPRQDAVPRPLRPHSPERSGPAACAAPRRRPYDGDAGGPAQHASGGAGVAYAIIAASPANANGVAAVSEAVKVIIIQPQAPGSGEGGSLPLPSQDPSPAPACVKTNDEDPEKISFMVALGLVTNEHLEGDEKFGRRTLALALASFVDVCLFLELQLKRQERKRRSTANPAYSGLFEPERKRLASHYLNGPLFLSARDSEDFCWKDEVEQDEICAVCRRDGELQPCHNCPRAYHPDCLQPPLKTPPGGPWYCPKCHKKVLNKENMSWPHNFVQSYVTHKTVRQEEKRRLLRRNVELKKECAHLEEEDEQLNTTFKRCLARRERLSAQQRDTVASLERLKALVKLIRVSASSSSSLSPSPSPWIKNGATTGSPLRPSRDNMAN
ncbi:PHD finger protein 21B isoform X2 [Stigmatopora nigra]